MSIGPMGFVGSVAGSPLSQVKGEVDRTRDATALAERKAASEAKAADASGIGRTDGDQEAGDRDADGRRLYEAPPESPKRDAESVLDEEPHRPADPTGTSGTQLDLTG
jgi:hypothetical protein